MTACIIFFPAPDCGQQFGCVCSKKRLYGCFLQVPILWLLGCMGLPSPGPNFRKIDALTDLLSGPAFGKFGLLDFCVFVVFCVFCGSRRSSGLYL